MSEDADYAMAYVLATAASAELRKLIAADVAETEPEELIRLADIAVGIIGNLDLRKKLSDNLIGGLTVLKFGKTFGQDIETGRRQALSVLDMLAGAPKPPGF